MVYKYLVYSASFLLAASTLHVSASQAGLYGEPWNLSYKEEYKLSADDKKALDNFIHVVFTNPSDASRYNMALDALKHRVEKKYPSPDFLKGYHLSNVALCCKILYILSAKK